MRRIRTDTGLESEYINTFKFKKKKKLSPLSLESGCLSSSRLTLLIHFLAFSPHIPKQPWGLIKPAIVNKHNMVFFGGS